MSEIISPKILGLTYSGEGDLIWADGNLNSLEGSPQVVNGSFVVERNEIVSLKYSPTKIIGNYVSSFNEIDFHDMPVIEVGWNFSFSIKHSSLPRIKNVNKLLSRLKFKNRIEIWIYRDFFINNGVGECLNNLFQRKKSGEDIELLYVEGMNWCCDQGFPADFWGEMNC